MAEMSNWGYAACNVLAAKFINPFQNDTCQCKLDILTKQR